MASQTPDPWAKWVLDQWSASDPERYKAAIESPNPVRERVLQNARLAEGDVILDIGAGAGLIAFNAARQVGERGRVIFSDVSQTLLDFCRSHEDTFGVAGRCQYLLTPAEDLSPLSEGSVDVVTVRSVLIYISDKQKAFDEFHRVLKPGGRLSVFEPINRFGHPQPPGQFWGYDVGPVWDVAQKVRALYERLQPAESDPMMNFDERDLLHQAGRAGFPDLHLELQVSVAPLPQLAWDYFLHYAGNPKIPSTEDAMRQVLTPLEAERLAAHLRPLVEAGKGTQHSAAAYLWATK